MIGFHTFRPKYATFSYRVRYHLTFVGLVDDVKPHLQLFLHHAVADGIVWNYLTESFVVPIAKGFLGFLCYSHSVLPTAPLHAHTNRMYWEVFLKLEALMTVNNVAVVNPE